MSKFMYDIEIGEIRQEPDGTLDICSEILTSLPHHKEIKSYVETYFEEFQIQEAFPESLRKNIDFCELKVRKTPEKKTVARIHVYLKRGVRLNEKIRKMLIRELEAQMSDGFGETLVQSVVPGTENWLVTIWQENRLERRGNL